MQRNRSILLGLGLALLLFSLFGMQAQAQEDVNNPGTIPPPGFATVNIAHFAPFAAVPADTSVTISVNGADVFTEVVYADTFTAISLSAGTYTVEVRPTGSSSVAISGVLTLASQVEYSVLAIGDSSAGAPLKLEAIPNDFTAPPVGSARILIGHYAPFNANPLFTAVELCNDDTNTPVGPPIIYGVNSGYLPLPAGIYDLSIALATTSCAQTVYDLPPLQFNPGASYDAFAIGKNNDAYPIEVVSLSGLDYPATATIGHFAPFANTVANTAVDIRVNGQVAFTNVVYGAYVPDVHVPSGPVLVEIVVPATAGSRTTAVNETVALSATVLLDPQVKYNLFAIGGANGWPLTFATAVISDVAPAGVALATVGHLAPFAPLAAQTAVDICLEDNTVLFADVQYGDIFPNVVLPPDRYDLKVAKHGTGCQTLVLDAPAFSVMVGDIIDVYAIGAPLDLFVPPLAEVEPAAGPEFPLQVVSTTGLPPAFQLRLPAVENPAATPD